MKYLIVLIILLIYSHAFAEDWMGYVLRHNYWGVPYYWVHDSSKWGYECTGIGKTYPGIAISENCL